MNDDGNDVSEIDLRDLSAPEPLVLGLADGHGGGLVELDDPLATLGDKVTSVLHDLDDQTWHETWAARPALRGWLHAAGLAVTVPTTVALAIRTKVPQHRVAVLVFGSSYSTMLAASASYHRLSRSPRQAQWLRRLDHSMIFVAVAGTYTPIALAVLPRKSALSTVAAAWTVAAAGTVSKLRLRQGGGSMMWIYLAFGWGGVAISPLVYKKGGIRPLVALGAGGLAYTLGAGVLAAKKPWPAPRYATYHELWHGFTLAGGALHGVAIALLLREQDRRRIDATPPRRRSKRTATRRRLFQRP